MTVPALRIVTDNANSLPALIDRAVSALANARTAAEVMDARDLAGVAYDAAKRAARFSKAKDAHDNLIAAAYRAQAHALEIEAAAKHRLADEYDAAQAGGEVGKSGSRTDLVPKGNEVIPSAKDAGLSRKQIHEAREVRDAEAADPGIVRRTLDEALNAGEEPTRAKVKRAVKAKVKRAVKAKSKRRRQRRRDPNSPTESQHDRDLRMLLGMWEAACVSARNEFLKQIAE